MVSAGKTTNSSQMVNNVTFKELFLYYEGEIIDN